jgi:hypothetical protein
MAIAERYHAYLDHFGPTVTLEEFHGSGAADLVALRHDVDHDLDVALEMAFWEHDRGVRSSYFLLHSSPYWDDDRFDDKVLQIQDFGHEIGLHHNVLTEWVRGETDDVEARLAEHVGRLRELGIRLRGAAAHGDKACYEHGFANYWCFEELRPLDPVSFEGARSAEGVAETDERFQLAYPSDHLLRRPDGATFKLWSVSMGALGLDYEAVRTAYDSYFTDSGGEWKRSADPLTVDLSRGRHQVLVHPEYWQDDAKRIWFFLSTARSGSRWLAEMLDRATPALARHEFTLNHDPTDTDRAEKRTGAGFARLVDDRDEARRLLIQARTWIEEQPGDYAEANVYLAHVLPELREVFPDATLVHLHRTPRVVARSLLSRDWYDTPEDDRHPPIPVPGWETMDQLGKVAWYIRWVNEALLDLGLARIPIEDVTARPEALMAALRDVGLPFYPRLAGDTFYEIVNAQRGAAVPAWEDWPRTWQSQFNDVIRPVRPRLGYVPPGQRGHVVNLARRIARRVSRLFRRWTPPPVVTEEIETIAEIDFRVDDFPVTAVGCNAESDTRGLVVTPEGGRHAHVVFGGPAWQRARSDEGWQARFGAWYRGDLALALPEGGTVTVFCLQYDDQGRQIARRNLGVVRRSQQIHFAFSVRADAARFALALQMPQDDLPARAVVELLGLEQVGRYTMTGRSVDRAAS